MSQEPFVTIDEVAKFFSVSVSTVRAWIRRGYLPQSSYLFLGNTYRFRITEVVDALRQIQEEEPEVEEKPEPQSVVVEPAPIQLDMFDSPASVDDDI